MIQFKDGPPPRPVVTKPGKPDDRVWYREKMLEPSSSIGFFSIFFYILYSIYTIANNCINIEKLVGILKKLLIGLRDKYVHIQFQVTETYQQSHTSFPY